MFRSAMQTGHYTRVNNAAANVLRRNGWVGVQGYDDQVRVLTRKQYDKYNRLETTTAREKYLNRVANGQNAG